MRRARWPQPRNLRLPGRPSSGERQPAAAAALRSCRGRAPGGAWERPAARRPHPTWPPAGLCFPLGRARPPGAGCTWEPRAPKMRAPARELFRDATFPASHSSLFSSFSTPLAQFREEITWKRPQEICATPRMFPDNPQEGQVKQGLLGDCWFLCACAALQKSRHLLDQVIPPGQPSWLDQTYRGSFACRIWQFGRWVEVTIDDRLPCLAGRLCFSRCQREDVFWLPLLEKAYAKVHGSYEHLWAGQVADALVDLTGGLAERWSLKDLARSRGPQDGPDGLEPRTCRQLLGLKKRCPISCSVFSPRAGARELGEFHAFIVSDLCELQTQAGQSVLLLRIQNPWGRRCWRGPWREGGEGWCQVDPGASQALLSQLREGEFWVEEEEFLREFDEVTIGYPVTEAGHLQSLHSGAEPHAGAARGLGPGAVCGGLPQQQQLSQQPQVLAAGLGTERSVRRSPAEAQEVHGGLGWPGLGTRGGRPCCVEPGKRPRQGLPGRGPASLEGSSRWRGSGGTPTAAPEAPGELCATSPCPGSEPTLPPVCRDLQGCALHLPARHRGHLHSDHSNQDRQALHPQPGDAGAAPPGGLLQGTDEDLTGQPCVPAHGVPPASARPPAPC
ncbi:calpain-10 isoform X3 [Desmodus rotundus]|uniref:calpain-10 isoform X3 n=1 Tax=Desmodus rotundus TaxID=9430 RepID=UPI002381645B|nr:calpain-10 isoform X3 [Desmodus rotundus]